MLEGDPLVRRLVALALSRVGLSIRGARNTSETLRMLADKPASLLLADLALVGTPQAFLAAVRRISPLPMLLGYEEGTFDPGQLAEVDIIARPYTAGELLAKIVTSLILAPPAGAGPRTAAQDDTMP